MLKTFVPEHQMVKGGVGFRGQGASSQKVRHHDLIGWLYFHLLVEKGREYTQTTLRSS